MKSIYKISWCVLLLTCISFTLRAQALLPVQWVKTIQQMTLVNSPSSIGTDGDGNVYVVGRISSSMNIDTSVFSASAGELYVLKMDVGGNLLNVFQYKVVISWDYPLIRVQPDGSFYIATAVYSQKVDLGNSDTLDVLGNNFILASFDMSGKAKWIRSSENNFSLTAWINPNSLDVDEEGNIVIGGNYWDVNGVFSVDTFVLPHRYAPNSQVFFAQYDAFGTVQWVKTIHNIDSSSSSRLVNGTAIRSAANGDVVVYGEFKGNITVGNSIVLSSDPGAFFLVKYDKDGDLIWYKSINALESKPGMMETDRNGNVFILGEIRRYVDFGGYCIGNCNLTGVNEDRSFLARFNMHGIFEWASVINIDTTMHYGRDDRDVSMAIDREGDLYLAGHYTYIADFGGMAQMTKSGAHEDIYVVKYTAGGIVTSLSRATLSDMVETPRGARVRGIVFDSYDNAYLMGTNENTQVLSSFCNAFYINPANAFVARLWYNTGLLAFSPAACEGDAVQFGLAYYKDYPGVTYEWNFNEGSNPTSTLPSPVHTYSTSGTYPVTLTISFPGTCERSMSGVIVVNKCVPEPDCEDCVSAFSPVTGKTYVASAWVKQEKGTLVYTHYEYPKLGIELTEGDKFFFTPTGEVIDGWQRIEGEFFVANTATEIVVRLMNESSDPALTVYFDDIRISPYDASVKSFVYDPESMRLVAELDNQNYATLYEYDEDGGLVRVKKETSKGVVTLKENRSNSRKKQ